MAIKPGIMNIGGGNTAPSSDETKKREEEKISEEEREAARRIVEGYYRNTVSSDNRGFTQDYANAVERAGTYGAEWTNENAPTDDISRAQENASGLARNTELYSGAVDKAFGSGVSGGLYDTYTDASKNLSDIRTGVRAQRDLYNQYQNADDYNADQRLFSMSSEELKKESDKIRQTLDETKKNAYKGILGFGYIKDADGRYRLYTPDSPMAVPDSIKSLEDQLLKLDALYNSKKYSEDVSKYGIDPSSMTYDQLMDTMRVGSDDEKRFALDYYNSLGQSNLQTKRAVEWYASLPKDEKAKIDSMWNSAVARGMTSSGVSLYAAQDILRDDLVKNGYTENEAETMADLYVRHLNEGMNRNVQRVAEQYGSEHPLAYPLLMSAEKALTGYAELLAPALYKIRESATGRPVDVNEPLMVQNRKYETAQTAAQNSDMWKGVQNTASRLFGEESGERVTRVLSSALYSGMDDAARFLGGLGLGAAGATASAVASVTALLASGGAGLTEFRHNIEEGKSTNEALARGILSAAIEFGTEAVGGEFVWNNILGEGAEGFFKSLAKAALAEGTEEIMGNVASRTLSGIADPDTWNKVGKAFHGGSWGEAGQALVNNSEWVKDVKAYTDQGLSLDSAMTRALGDWVSEDADAFLSAFLSAGLSFGLTRSIKRANTNSSKKVVGDMVNSLTHDGLLKMVRSVEAKLKSGESDGKPYTKEAAADDVERVRGALVNARENIAQAMTGEESTAEDRAFAEKEAEKINRAIGQVEELSSAIRNDRTAEIPQVAASIEASIREETEREAEEARTKSKRERAISDFVRGLVYGGTRMAQIDQDLSAEIRRLDADAKSGVEGAQKKLDFANEALTYLRRYAADNMTRDGLKSIGKSLDLLGHGKDRSVTIQYDFTWNDDQRNASYNRETNTVTLNPYSPMTQNHVRFVLGHELLHALRADGERGQAIVDSAWNTIQSLMESGQIRRDDENYNMDVLTKLYAGDVRSYLNGADGRAEVASYVKHGMTEEAAQAKAAEQYLKEEAVANFFGDASFWGLDKNGNPVDRRTLMWSENDTEQQRREKAKQLKNLSPLFDVNAVLSDLTQSKARRVLSDFVRTIRNFARSIVGAKPVEAKRFDTLADAYEAVLKRFDAKPVKGTANTENASEAAQGAATEGVERNSRSVAGSDTVSSEDSAPTVVLSDNGQVAAVDDVAVASNMADLITEDPRPTDYDDPERHSITTKDQWEKSYLNAGGESVVAEQMDRLTEAMIANNLIYGYVPTGDYDYSERGPLRDNVEYGVSFDLDASCPRTFQFLFYRNKLQRIAGRPLTYNESMQLIELMKAYGQNIPCSYCYVETKRILQASNFLNWFKYHTDVLTAETDAEAKRRMYSYNAKKGTLSKAAQEVFDEWRSGDRSYTPSAQDVWFAAQTARNSVMNYLDGKLESGEITADAPKTDLNRDVLDRFGVTDEKATSEIGEYVDQWLYDTKAKVPHLYSVFNNEDASEVDERALSMYRTAMNYAKSASSARGVDNYVPYTDQLRNIPAELKQKILAMGGLRKHSSNDFRMDYVHDYFLLFADMALGGWTGHTYTKNTDYVKIFGRTGDRINMSVAFEERGGRLYENVQEGMNWRDARQLRRDYYDNVGVMAMVTSNRQLNYALNAEWIDMIIPFHASGMAKAVWYNMKAWSDFTSKQNERFKTKAQMTAELKEKGVKVPSKANAAEVREMYDREMEIVKIYDKDGKRVVPHILPGDYVFNGQTIEGHRNDPEAYLRLCKKYGVRPRFQGIKVDDGNGREIDVTEHPNYFRLIKETARTETEQKPIQFNFNEKDDALGMTPFEYAMERMEQEAKIGGFGNLAEDKYGIVRKFVDNFLGKNKPLPRVLDDKGKPTKQSMYDMLPEEAKEFLDYLWEKQKDVNGQQYEVVEDSVNEVSERSSRSAIDADSLRKPTDLVELNDRQLSNREKTESNAVVGSALYTLGGSAIKRFRNVVGKNLGTDKEPQVYLHKSAVGAAEDADIIPRGLFDKADKLLRSQRPDFKYNAIMYDAKKPGVIRFDEAPNFDKEREPVVGWQVNVDTENGTVSNVSKSPSKTIWHHKWNWVTDDYDGFDQNEAWNWSKKWLSTITPVPEDTDLEYGGLTYKGVANGSSQEAWNEQLDLFDLPKDEAGTTRYSLSVVPPIEATSDKWQRGHNEEWFKKQGFPVLEDVSAEWIEARKKKGWKEGRKPLSEKGFDGVRKKVGTQVTDTVETYKRIFDYLESYLKEKGIDKKNFRILDASSGYGLGTEVGLNRKFNVTDIEPFVSPDSDYMPDYMDYSSLQKHIEDGDVEPFDFIISNAVLNVIAQDTRDNMVKFFDSVLAPGGRIYVNTLSKSYVTIKNAKEEIQYDKYGKKTGGFLTQRGENGAGNEVFVWGSSSVQKGYSRPELIAYLEDGLPGYTVKQPEFKAGSEASVVVQKPSSSERSSRSVTSEENARYMELAKDPVKNADELQKMVDEAAINNAFTYRRNTGRKLSALQSNYVPYAMFVEGKLLGGNEFYHDDLRGYGDNEYVATDSGAIDIDDIYDDIQRMAEEYYGETIDYDTINPPDIVISAGIFDDPDFVQYMWDNYFEGIMNKTGVVPSVKTSDGLVFLGADDSTDRIKSLAAVTYDSEGNVIPLTERFNENEKDIRHSRSLTPEQRKLLDAERRVERLKEEKEFFRALTQKGRKAALSPRDADRIVREIQESFDVKDERIRAALGIVDKLYNKKLVGEERKNAEQTLKSTVESIVRDAYDAETEDGDTLAEWVQKAISDNVDGMISAMYAKYAKYGDSALPQQYMARIRQIEADAERDARAYQKRIADLESQARAKAMRGSATEMLDAARKNARYIWSAAKNPTGKKFVPQNARGAMERLANWIDSITVRGGVLRVNGETAERPSAPVRGDVAVIAEVYGSEYAEPADALLNTIDYYAKYQSGADYQRERNAEKSEWIAKSTYKLSQLLRSAVANQNRVWLDGKRRDAETIGGDMIDALNERRGADERFTSVKDKTFGEKAKESASKLLHLWKTNPGLAATDAYTFWYRFGDSGYVMVDTLRNAQETQTLRNQEFVEAVQTKLKGIELWNYADEKWDRYTVTFKDARGREVTVPRSVAMSVAALWRRMQGREHLENGGFVYDHDGKRSDPIRVGEKSVKAIEDALTEDDKKVMEVMLSFMRDECTKWGNEATMRRYGFERFTTDNYFRIDVDKFALPANTDKSFSGQPKIENTSFAKPTSDGAGAPVVAGDFIRSVIHHVNGMATYSAYLNAEGTVNQILSTKGLRETMQRTLGNGSVKYVEDLMTDLKSQTRNEEDALEKLWSMGAAYYKTAAVAYNLSTALKQPISYTRAAAVMDTKYLARGMKAVMSSEGRNRALGEMQEFSGTAVKKLNGYSDTGMARDTAMLIGAKKETVRQKIVEFGMRGAEFGDRITWEALWTACREETRDRNPDLTPAELMEATAKRFASVVAQTQVTNSPLDTAPILRSNSVLTRNLFAFWNEPLKTYNLLMRAYDNIVQAKDGAAAKRAILAAARPVASVAAGMVLEAAVSALFRSLRDDRDDDMDDPETWKKLISLWGGEMVNNVLGVLPYVDQFAEVIRNAVKGYSNTDMGLEVITDILDAAKALADSDGEKAKTEFSRIRALAEAVATAFGIPAKNVLRTVKTIFSTALNFGGNIKAQYNYQKIFYNPRNATAREKYGFADLLAKAYIEGDEEAYRYIRDDMIQMGLSPASITKSIVKNAMPDDVDGSSSSLTAYKPGSDGWYLAMGAVYDRATGAPRGLEEEVTRLYEATGDSGVLPNFAPDSFTADGKEVKIEGEAYTEFSESYAKRLYEVQTVIRNTAGYRAASDEQKAWWLEKAETVVGAILKHGIDPDYNVTSQGKWIADYLNATDAAIGKYIVENTKKSVADSQQTKTRGAEVVNTPKSTEFSQIGYDPSTGTLAVTFRDSGATYTYGGVPESEWDAMQGAASIGKYYNENIKGKYKSEKAG